MGLHIYFGYFIGAAVAGVICWRMGFRRRAEVTPETWWILLLIGFVLMMWSALHSTMPSFARRVTAISTVSSCVTVEHRRSIKFVIHLDQGPGGPIYLDTQLVAPCCRKSSGQRTGNIYKIVYLDTPDLDGNKEAIAISVLDGPDKGWHREVDARPFGLWLGIPIGSTLGLLGMIGLKLENQDLKKCRIEDKKAERPRPNNIENVN
jgi:hypothetical protein